MRFAALFGKHLDALAREWVDRLYADRRTDHATILSFRELVGHLPELFEELAFLLDTRADYPEIVESARRLRAFPQARFQQGLLLDEVARELMLLRDTLNEFLWREASGLAGEDGRGLLRDALRRADAFLDELIAQTVLVYAVSLRPVVETRESVWPPPRRRRRTRPPERDLQE